MSIALSKALKSIIRSLEYLELVSDVESGSHSQSARDTRAGVIHNGAIQIGHHHHIELLRRFHQLHSAIVNNHLFVLKSRVLGSHVSAGLQEYTVADLPF